MEQSDPAMGSSLGITTEKTNYPRDIERLRETLSRLKNQGKILMALVHGTLANRTTHPRWDLHLAIYMNAQDQMQELSILEEILRNSARDVFILRLDDEKQPPMLVREALRGIHLVEPDQATLSRLTESVEKACRGILFPRDIKNSSKLSKS
ncbi:MAG: nucleotidyltransferase domain-containing protein [bacterium]